MLQYEAKEINVAQGLRAPLSDEERYHYDNYGTIRTGV